jgi:hypothetical protein
MGAGLDDVNTLLKVLGSSSSAIAAVKSWSKATQAASYQVAETIHSASQSAKQAFAQMSADEQQFTLQVVRGSGLVMSALNRELEAHKKLTAGLRAAYQQALKELAEYLAKEAEMKAMEQIAMATADFATMNFVGGAEHLAAAAAWEALGAGISAAAGAIAGSNQRTSGSRGYGASRSRANATDSYEAPTAQAQGAYGTPGSTLAPGAQPAAMPSGGGLTVSIMGDEEAGQWLATTLNKAVTQGGVQLTATGSQRGAPVGH